MRRRDAMIWRIARSAYWAARAQRIGRSNEIRALTRTGGPLRRESVRPCSKNRRSRTLHRMQKIPFTWLGLVLGVGCHTAPVVGAVEASAPEASAVSSATIRPATRRPADITPQIIAKATELLWANDSAQIGTEFPFDMNGKRYVARMEMHDNPDGDPDRPQGEHKGMTIYVLDE